MSGLGIKVVLATVKEISPLKEETEPTLLRTASHQLSWKAIIVFYILQLVIKTFQNWICLTKGILCLQFETL